MRRRFANRVVPDGSRARHGRFVGRWTESMVWDIYNVPLDRLVATLVASIAKGPEER